MYQKWSALTFLHWEADAEMLQGMLPAGLTLDTFEGRAFVGLVPFTMSGIRPRGMPAVRGLSDFHETNVRTYVHCGGQDPGVWFFSLEAANAIAVRLARAWFHLPYHYAEMSLQVDTDGTHTYESRRLWPKPVPAHCRVMARPVSEPAAALPGSLEHFLAERYLLYSSDGNRLWRGQVHHAPYPLQRAEACLVDQTLTKAAGITHSEGLPMAHYAGGVSVEVFGLKPAGQLRTRPPKEP
jgi:uncharacterized protein YqjF (DUF2071 family)